MIELIRDTSCWGQISDQMVLTYGNDEYQYYHLSGYCDINRSSMPGGYYDDFFAIKRNGELCGYVGWHIDRPENAISEVGVFLFEPYLNSGVGVVALAKFMDYAVKVFFKINFSVATKNVRANKAYEKLLEMGARYVGRKEQQRLSAFGERVDVDYYELISSRFKPTKSFTRLVNRK